jgi:hypothetical protein
MIDADETMSEDEFVVVLALAGETLGERVKVPEPEEHQEPEDVRNDHVLESLPCELVVSWETEP